MAAKLSTIQSVKPDFTLSEKMTIFIADIS